MRGMGGLGGGGGGEGCSILKFKCDLYNLNMTLMVGHYQSRCLVKRFYSSVKVKVTTKVKNFIECLI